MRLSSKLLGILFSCVFLNFAYAQNISPAPAGGGGGSPTGAAGGGLTGTYPNPTVATVPASALGGMSTLSNALGANVLLNNTANFFIGPTVSQGTAGTWLAMGQVSVTDGITAATIICRLTDGVTVMASAAVIEPSTTADLVTIPFFGVVTSPVGNIRIECKDASSVNGTINWSSSGLGKDSTLTVIRIN